MKSWKQRTGSARRVPVIDGGDITRPFACLFISCFVDDDNPSFNVFFDPCLVAFSLHPPLSSSFFLIPQENKTQLRRRSSLELKKIDKFYSWRSLPSVVFTLFSRRFIDQPTGGWQFSRDEVFYCYRSGTLVVPSSSLQYLKREDSNLDNGISMLADGASACIYKLPPRRNLERVCETTTSVRIKKNSLAMFVCFDVCRSRPSISSAWARCVPA